MLLRVRWLVVVVWIVCFRGDAVGGWEGDVHGRMNISAHRGRRDVCLVRRSAGIAGRDD